MFQQVQGYIDAGTGSYLLAAIAGGLATVWFFIRAKIDRLLGRTAKAGDEGAANTVSEEVDSADEKTPGSAASATRPE